MARAVRWDDYGSVDVLNVVEVDRPSAGPDEVVVEVVSTSINPGEIPVREGRFRDRWPATFPSGQGSDLAGRVVEVGAEVRTFAVGDEVIGFTDNRAAQADYVAVSAENVTPKPAEVSWDAAGSLYVVGTTAYAAARSVALQPGETVAVSAAAGGVGSLVVQLARRAGATVIGIAGPDNARWLESLGVTPVLHGDGLRERLRAVTPDGIDAFLDNFGSGYVELALDLGVPSSRINTIIDVAAVEKFGVKYEGNAKASSAAVLAELAKLIANGELVVPIATTYPLEQVRDAYNELAKRHTHGKIVLRLR
jgi:NADPH:quinone reductase-like Zn-dependent oxidoreductase